MREKYGALAPFIANREDLNFVLTEMGSELMAGHIYVERGRKIQSLLSTTLKRLVTSTSNADATPRELRATTAGCSARKSFPTLPAISKSRIFFPARIGRNLSARL